MDTTSQSSNRARSGGKNRIKQDGTWKNAEVALATSTSVGNPAPLFASQLGLPAGSITSGMTIGKARVTLYFSKPRAWPTGGLSKPSGSRG